VLRNGSNADSVRSEEGSKSVVSEWSVVVKEGWQLSANTDRRRNGLCRELQRIDRRVKECVNVIQESAEWRVSKE